MSVYWDANAGQLLGSPSRRGLTSLLAQLETQPLGLGANPSSRHRAGQRAKVQLLAARDQVAASLGLWSSAHAERPTDAEVIFTSGATESIQTVIRSFVSVANGRNSPGMRADSLLGASPPGRLPLLSTSTLEHSAVHACIEELGCWDRVFVIKSLPTGVVDLRDVQAALDAGARRFSLQWVNNETGVIQPIEEILKCLEAVPGAYLHLDAVQAWGKLRVNLSALSDRLIAVSFSGHKIGAPSGIGVLVLRGAGRELISPLIPGKQQQGRRGGTENLLGAHLLGLEAQALTQRLNQVGDLRLAREKLESMLRARIPGCIIHGESAPRVENTICFSISGNSEKMDLVAFLDLNGFCVSSGSACQSGTRQPSHVLLAMGVPTELALQSLRVSWAEPPLDRDLERFVSVLEKTVAK